MLATVLITVVALIHLYILVLEMFLWNTKTGHKAGKIHEHARIYRLRSVAGSQILNFMS